MSEEVEREPAQEPAVVDSGPILLAAGSDVGSPPDEADGK